MSGITCPLTFLRWILNEQRSGRFPQAHTLDGTSDDLTQVSRDDPQGKVLSFNSAKGKEHTAACLGDIEG